MGSEMFLLLVLVLLMFPENNQGVPETHKQSLAVSTFPDASAVGEPQTTANPVITPRQHNRWCNCKGKRREMVAMRCLCREFARRSGRQRKRKAPTETFYQRKKKKNVRKSRQFSKQEKGGRNLKLSPSIPL